MGGSVVLGMLGAFLFLGGEIMERDMNYIQWGEDGSETIRHIQGFGLRPIKTLVRLITNEDSFENQLEYNDLCQMLKEKIDELDECLDRVRKEQDEAHKAKSAE